MKLLKIIPLFAILLSLTGCGTLTKSEPFSVSTKLEMNMNDLIFLGESEISCEYDTYLGFIRHINKVNGETYQPGDKTKLNIHQRDLHFNSKGMKLASSKLLKDYPQARFFQIVLETKDTDVMFLGSTTKRVAKVRCYKFK